MKNFTLSNGTVMKQAEYVEQVVKLMLRSFKYSSYKNGWTKEEDATLIATIMTDLIYGEASPSQIFKMIAEKLGTRTPGSIKLRWCKSMKPLYEEFIIQHPEWNLIQEEIDAVQNIKGEVQTSPVDGEPDQNDLVTLWTDEDDLQMAEIILETKKSSTAVRVRDGIERYAEMKGRNTEEALNRWYEVAGPKYKAWIKQQLEQYRRTQSSESVGTTEPTKSAPQTVKPDITLDDVIAFLANSEDVLKANAETITILQKDREELAATLRSTETTYYELNTKYQELDAYCKNLETSYKNFLQQLKVVTEQDEWFGSKTPVAFKMDRNGNLEKAA